MPFEDLKSNVGVILRNCYQKFMLQLNNILFDLIVTSSLSMFVFSTLFLVEEAWEFSYCYGRAEEGYEGTLQEDHVEDR